MRIYLLALCLLLNATAPASAQTRPNTTSRKTVATRTPAVWPGLPEGFEPLRRAGAAALYDLDYETAEAQFKAMIQLDPTHPAGQFYLATCRWLVTLQAMRRLQIGLYTNDTFFAGSGDQVAPELERSFREAVKEAINLANARLRRQRDDLTGLYFLGAAFGLLTTYEASVMRNFDAAVDNARLSVKQHEELAEHAPAFADPYLTLGLFQYFVGKLPWYKREPLRLIKITGNRQRGMEWVRRAMTQGLYVNDDACTVLVAIERREGRFAEALKLLEGLIQKYPRNYLFRLERASVLSLLGRYCDSDAAFADLLRDKAAQSIADQIHFQYGEALLAGGEAFRAALHFISVTQMPQADPALITLAHLRHGQTLDSAGYRTEAKARYQLALKRADVFDSRKTARKYLENPFVAEKATREKCAK